MYSMRARRPAGRRREADAAAGDWVRDDEFLGGWDPDSSGEVAVVAEEVLLRGGAQSVRSAPLVRKERARSPSTLPVGGRGCDAAYEEDRRM